MDGSPKTATKWMQSSDDISLWFWCFPLSMSFRKRKHGYEDDDHIVKRQMMAEEVSLFEDYLFLKCASSGYSLKLMHFLFCRSGLTRIWMHCDNEIVFKLATSSEQVVIPSGTCHNWQRMRFSKWIVNISAKCHVKLFSLKIKHYFFIINIIVGLLYYHKHGTFTLLFWKM